MDNLPEPKQEASITDAVGAVHPVIVQGFQNGRVLLQFEGRPTAPDDETTPLDLTWGVKGASHFLPVVYMTGLEAGTLTLWAVEPAGAPARVQRREYVRMKLGTALVVEVEQEDDEDGEPQPPLSLTCRLIDISEMSLRGEISASETRHISLGTVVTTTFTFGPSSLRLAGEIFRLLPGRDDLNQDFVVQFDHTEQDRRLLRRRVFAEQVRLRNLFDDIRT